ncbi:MAG: chorismate mutase [Spartobacteria bacterium]|nr:chorismate mutase [Spartobacteria bacterium]
MDRQLELSNIRHVLIRLEETIIFGLIERAQFAQNLVIYQKGGVGDELPHESLMDFMLHETEKTHALVRRYTSPDEHPFFDDLPAPILPALDFSTTPLHPNAININRRIRRLYEQELIPKLCRPGDDRQYGSSAVNDVILLQSLSKRIHYGKFVAESKFRGGREPFDALIRARDEVGIMRAITNAEVERDVLDRVHLKATTYGRELDRNSEGFKVDPDLVRNIYAQWVIPLNKEVQVAYLLQRLISDASP